MSRYCFDEIHFQIAEKALTLSVECSVKDGGDVLERAQKYYRFLKYEPTYLFKLEKLIYESEMTEAEKELERLHWIDCKRVENV